MDPDSSPSVLPPKYDAFHVLFQSLYYGLSLGGGSSQSLRLSGMTVLRVLAFGFRVRGLRAKGLGFLLRAS